MPSGCNVLQSSHRLTEAGANLLDTIGLVPLFPPVASFVPASRSAMMSVLGMHMENTGRSILPQPRDRHKGAPPCHRVAKEGILELPTGQIWDQNPRRS